MKGFADAIIYVDGTQQPLFKRYDDDIQKYLFFGNDKIHCYAILIYVDIYGLIRSVYVSYSGGIHEKKNDVSKEQCLPQKERLFPAI